MPGTEGSNDDEYEPAGPPDKTFGQAAAEDQATADEALRESGGDEQQAEQQFDAESNAAED